MKNKLLVSACLMGFQVRYNGSEKAQLAATLSRWQQKQAKVKLKQRQQKRNRS